jgi:hypothetical protein
LRLRRVLRKSCIVNLARPCLLFVLLFTLCQCSVLDPVLRPSKVVFALASHDGLPSPLGSELSPVGEVILFSRDHFTLTERQTKALRQNAQELAKAGEQDLLIVGFARRGLPSSHARTLSQRRAETIRQTLIEGGLPPAKLHSVGYGNDQPALGIGDEVRLYRAPSAPAAGAETRE